MSRVDERALEDQRALDKKSFKPIKRGALPSSLTWNRSREDFPKFQERFDSHLFQTGMAYIRDPVFLKQYKRYRCDVFNHYTPQTLPPNYYQFLDDIQILFGYMKGAYSNTVAQKEVRRHADTADGILAYIDVRNEYQYGGGKEVIIEKLELRLSKPYDESSTGGLVEYIDKLENSFLELTEYGITKTEQEKYRLLKRNLFVEGITDHLVMQMDEKYRSSKHRFTRVVKWLRAKVIQLDYHRGNHATKEAKKRRSARLAQAQHVRDHDDIDQSNLLMTYDVIANMARNQRSDDWVPRDIFNKLEPEVKQQILDIRDELRANRRTEGGGDRNYNDRSRRPSFDRNAYDGGGGQAPQHRHNIGEIPGVPKDSIKRIPKQYGHTATAAAGLKANLAKLSPTSRANLDRSRSS
jgi:hypothetical protein